MPPYIVKSPLNFNGNHFEIGEEIDLENEQAESLLAVGAIVSKDATKITDEGDDRLITFEEIMAAIASANEALAVEIDAHNVTKNELAQVKTELEATKAELEATKANLANVPVAPASEAGNANGESTASADAIAEQTDKNTNPEASASDAQVTEAKAKGKK